MRNHGGETGQGSSYILGVQKLTMSRGVLLWFWEGFCETEAPRGQMEVEWGRRSAVGLGLSAGPCKGCLPLFPQCQRHRCVNNNGRVQSMAHCIVIVLCVAGAQR